MQTKTEGQSRQDQILLLAAEGLTDKEIAGRLGLSAETVGTYWRRILAKHNAASRTEVVAKVIELRAEGEKHKLEDLSKAFREVTDHLFLQLEALQTTPHVASTTLWQDLVDSLDDVFAVLDEEAFVIHRSKGTPQLTLCGGEPLEWSVHAEDRDAIRKAIGEAISGRATDQVQARFAYADGSYMRHRVNVCPLGDTRQVAIQVLVE